MGKPFGEFFCCSNHSIWSIKIPSDLRSSPVVTKMATNVSTNKSGGPLENPVGGVMRYGYFVGITSQGLYKYYTPQGPDKPLGEPPTRFELVGRFNGTKKFSHSPTIVGLFLWRQGADDCHALVKNQPAEMFDRQWWEETRQVLMLIGTNHPLISISTEHKFAVPQHLYDPSCPVPAEVIE